MENTKPRLTTNDLRKMQKAAEDSQGRGGVKKCLRSEFIVDCEVLMNTPSNSATHPFGPVPKMSSSDPTKLGPPPRPMASPPDNSIGDVDPMEHGPNGAKHLGGDTDVG
jgi:hypothetical protein